MSTYQPDIGASRTQLAQRVADRLGVDPDVVRRVIDTFIDEMLEVFRAGRKVNLRGFGVFSPVDRPERATMQPGTQRRVMVPASRTVTFRPTKAFKTALNQRR